MFGCAPKVGLSTTRIPNEIKGRRFTSTFERQTCLYAPDNTNSNVNSVDDNNSNDIPVPMDCEHECSI